MLGAVGLDGGVARVLQAPAQHAQRALVQDVVAGGLRLVIPAHAGERVQRHRGARVVGDPLGDGEHVVAIHRDLQREHQPGAVIPAERHGRGLGQAGCGGRPHRGLVRQLHAGRVAGPAVLDVVRLRVGLRLQHAHQRGGGADLLVVVAQHQVVQHAAAQADAALHPAGAHRDPRHVPGRRHGFRFGAREGWIGARHGVRRRLVHDRSGVLARRRGRFRQQELEAEQDRDGHRDGDDEASLVHAKRSALGLGRRDGIEAALVPGIAA